MPEYSKEDKLAFKKKDYLYARQTASNVTASVFEGKEIDLEGFIEYADKIFNWLFQEQDPLPDTVPVERSPTSVIPKPTADQVPVLKAVMEQTGLDKDSVCIGVLDYSTNVLHKTVPTYPTNMESVGKIVEWINEGLQV